jgi:threonine dehydratase
MRTLPQPSSQTHARHLAGGRSPDIDNERLFRFEFPERPGALRDFLNALRENNDKFNVSLFHYRNHGSDVGRVLVALQVPPAHDGHLADFLASVGFGNVEETDNPVYQHFLR